MHHTTIIQSPVRFLVEDYAPGYTIDFQHPAAETDLERARQTFDYGRFSERQTDRELAVCVGQQLVGLGIIDHADDFGLSLGKVSSERSLDKQLSRCLRRLGVMKPPSGRVERVRLLMERTRCLARPAHYPIRLYCHVPGEVTHLEAGATHYAYVLAGECSVVERTRRVVVVENTFFCLAGGASIEGRGKVEVITRFGYVGVTQYGGEVEPWGRLNYIDGCTDTVLVHPSKKGDPCYNALYFPEFTDQTQHVHPSLRCGLIISGRGVCKTPYGDHELAKGKLFFLPPETYHSFHTSENVGAERSALTVIAFHPDSDFGPTDDDHPMVNRTYFKFLHRIVSAERQQAFRAEGLAPRAEERVAPP